MLVQTDCGADCEYRQILDLVATITLAASARGLVGPPDSARPTVGDVQAGCSKERMWVATASRRCQSGSQAVLGESQLPGDEVARAGPAGESAEVLAASGV